MLKFHRVLVITNLDLDSLAFTASPFKKVAGVYPQKLHGYTIQSSSNNKEYKEEGSKVGADASFSHLWLY